MTESIIVSLIIFCAYESQYASVSLDMSYIIKIKLLICDNICQHFLEPLDALGSAHSLLY
jgi:hypothetical protein